VVIGNSQTLALQGALLFYRGPRAFATWHSVVSNEQHGLALSEAQPLTLDFICAISQGLASHPPIEVLPEHVLVRTADTLVWWTASSRRTMFFRATNESVAPLNGQRFSHPPLVWKVSGHELWVRALRKNARPTADTPLFVAPYWNVNGEDGLTCQGSMRSPEDAGVESIRQWEQAFFQSEFTHATGIRPLTNHSGGFAGLWENLADSGKPFPTNRLVAAKQTLWQFVQEP
jgi:PRTRC genetic system protein B